MRILPRAYTISSKIAKKNDWLYDALESNIMDEVPTLSGLHKGDAEGNPIASELFKQFGPEGLSIIF